MLLVRHALGLCRWFVIGFGFWFLFAIGFGFWFLFANGLAIRFRFGWYVFGHT